MDNLTGRTNDPAQAPLADVKAADMKAEKKTQAGNSDAASAPKASDARRRPGTWIKMLLPPVLILCSGAIVIMGLGAAQRLGFITAGGGHAATAGAGQEDVRYICPMMCTPPQSEPGRCPVCAMELVPAASEADDGEPNAIEIDPASRRVANIQSVAVQTKPLTRTIRAIGEMSYDEGTLRTIAAYVDGRIERLYADYTGAVVAEGDHLALLYSPQLYSSQVELLVARRARQPSQASRLSGAASRDNLYESARERLIEFGMTQEQIARLEAQDKANSRLQLCAPISGTVIEKKAVEGQYVKTGQVIYQLADLSTVWLMLELFPDDAAVIRYGQQVEAIAPSLPGKTFTGRVAFVDPTVDPKTRTVGVRVVIPNQRGLLRVGDYATATINVPVATDGGALDGHYDPALAGKWISPRHPHVVESSPGHCRLCGVDLVPAQQFGFVSSPLSTEGSIVVPRNAVLLAGATRVVYVETRRGRFEMRPVKLGPRCGEDVAILEGLSVGETVAVNGAFLIDSQMQLAGKPSLIDPTRAQPLERTDDAPGAGPVAGLPPIGPISMEGD